MCDINLIPLITLIIIIVTSIIIPLLNKLWKLCIKYRRGNRGLCINCGVDSLRPYKEDYYFCDTCRKPQRIRKTRIWTCPKCSTLNKIHRKKIGHEICRQCGDAYPNSVPHTKK